jgi:hypothetical protein
MKKGLWGGLLLSLGWVSGLAAQEETWRAASDAPPAASVPEVELDRPIPALPAGQRPPPLPNILPAAFDQPATPGPPAPLPPMLARPMPAPVVIAASATFPAGATSPANAPESAGEASEFATARTVASVVPIGVPAAAAPTPAANPGPLPVFAPPAAYGPSGFNPWAPAPADGNPWTADPGPFALPPEGPNLLYPCFYLTGEYLLWWTKGENTPVLLTTSSPSDFGVLGNPTTRVLFGGNQINDQARSGARFNFGWWLNDDRTFAIDGSFFFLGMQTTNFSANSGAFPVLARPFSNVNSNQQFSELLALPNVATGIATIHNPSTLWGFDVNLKHQLCCGCNWRINGLMGFRYLYLGESINFTENIQGEPTAPAPFTNETILVFDRFATFNQFYGGQVGVDGRYQYGRWTFGGFTKLGLGSTVQTLDISGFQHFMSPSGAASAFQGGLLALPGANIGHHHKSAFSVVPEVGINVGYQFTPHLRAFVGYNFLYWTNVIRPGDQIDTRLNVDKIPNFPTSSPPSSVNLPSVPFRESNFWAQGFLCGLELTF